MGIRIIGLTGGIGSGKSTVADIMARCGARIVDADVISRKIIVKGSDVLNEITAEFGPGVTDDQGNLDRHALSLLVFRDSKKLGILNDITHKHIAAAFRQDLKRQKQELGSLDKNGIIVISVPLPVKAGFLEYADEIWVVDASRENRLKRIMKRNGYDEAEAIARMDSQQNTDEYLRLADRVISNNEGTDQLKEKVEGLMRDISDSKQYMEE